MSGRRFPMIGHDHAAGDHDRDQQRAVERRPRRVAVLAEQEQRPEDHEQVPLQRDGERERRRDVDVEDDHPDDGDRPDRPALRDEQQEREAELHHRAEVRGQEGLARGAHVGRVVAVEPRLCLARAVPRRVADHHRDDVGEMAVQLRGGGAEPDADEDDLRGDDQVLDREQEDHEQQPVQLRPRAQVGDLVAQAEQDEEADQHRDIRRIETAGQRPGDGLTVGQQQEHRRREHAREERHVEQRARRAARQRHAVRERRQPDRPGPQPVEARSERRHEAERQSHRARAESDQLPQDHPDDDLLEDDRLGPPVADVAEAADPRRGCRDHEQRRRTRTARASRRRAGRSRSACRIR